MLKSTVSCLLLLALLALPQVAFGEQSQAQPSVEKSPAGKVENKQPFTVLVLDPDGKPVADALVGHQADREIVQSIKEWRFWGTIKRWTIDGLYRIDVKPAITNAKGRTQMFADEMPRATLTIVARHASKKLVGIATASRGAVLSSSKDEPAITVSLQPECRVHGLIQSTGLEEKGQELKYFTARVELDGNRIFVLNNAALNGRQAFAGPAGKTNFEFFLPPGTYSLVAIGGFNRHADTIDEYRSFTVPTATADLDLGPIDLPPSKMTTLIGQPAPEIADVVAWKNSEPLKLADLHGKYVLLEFWGHWCVPCVQRMPKLFEVHDKFSKRGLVIIGVHVGLEGEAIDSGEKLDAAVAGPRKNFWAGRDLPFPVAMVAFRQLTHIGSNRAGFSQAAVDYGVRQYPSQVLIDPDGKVVGWFDEKDHIKLFEALPKVE